MGERGKVALMSLLLSAVVVLLFSHSLLHPELSFLSF